MALLTGLAASPASADNLYWDADGGTTPSLGGTGTWNTSGLNWSTNNDGIGGPFNAWSNVAGDNAIFAGTAGTVTLGAPITVGGLTFNVSGYTIAGTAANPLTLGGTTPTITATGNATISAVIAGSAGLTKAGAGSLTLTGANTFTGGVIVSAGGLAVGSDAALGNSSNIVTLSNNTSLTATGALSASRQVVLNGSVSIAGAGVGSALFTGSGNLAVGAGATLTNDNNDFTGTVTLNGVFVPSSRGDIYFSSVRNVGEASSLGAGGTITFTRGDSTNIIHYTGDGDSSNRDWVMSGGSIRRFYNEGTGALTLTGNFDLQQSIQFNAATADFNVLGALSGAGGVLFSGSTGRTITLGSANSYSGATTVSAMVIAPTLADIGSNSSFGTGNSNSLIDINNGTLSYTGGAASSNRTWQFSGAADFLNDGLGGLTLTGAAQFNPGPTLDVLTLGGGFTGENTLSGALTGTGSVVMDGSGTWVLSGNNSYTGTTTVANGTLKAGSATAFNQQNSLIVNGGTFDLGGYDYGFTRLDGTGGTVALGSGNLTLTLGTGVNSNYGGSISGAGGLTKLGAGTLTLTGQSTYTGATTVGGGTLALDFSPATGPTSNIISASSPLIMNGGTVKITGAAGETNVQSFGGLTITTGNNTVSTTSGTGGSSTINFGNITRTGGLANFVLPTTGAMTTTGPDRVLGGWAIVNGSDYAKVQGGNIVAFTAADYVNKDDASTWLANEIISDAGGAANTPYFGTVGSSVQIGGLQYTAAASSTVTVAAGQTLGVDGTIIVAPSVTGGSQTITGGMMTGTLGGGVLGVQQNGGGTFTIASTIVDNTGTVGFSKAGTGKVALSGSNTYTGATAVSQGTLSINSVANGGAASAIGAASADSSNLVIEGATLEYTGASASTDRGFSLGRSGAVTSGTITVTNAATNLTISGQVVSPDGAGLTKTGPGTLTLSNTASTYTGVTTVSQGTLAVTTLANGGSPSSIGAADNASSNLVLQGAGELEYLGGTTTSNRGFTLASGGGAIDVAQGATTLTMSGVAAGAGSLTKNGPGTLVLSGANTYTGGATVSAGILRAGSTSAFGTGAMTVNTGATLDLANNNNTVRGLSGAGNVTLGSATLTTNGNGSFSGTLGGTGGVTVATGAQTFSGCTNSYGGATTITGTLSVSCLRNGGQASDIGASTNASANLQLIGGTLDYTGGSVTTDRGFTLGGTGTINVATAATTLEFSGVATGTSLQKTGPGTLVLSGANTYNGATYVNGGILRAGSTSAFGTSGLRMDTTGATLDLNNFNNTVTYISQLNLGITGGNITLGSATLTISDGSGGNYNGAISGSGGLVKNGASAQSLSGGASSYTGSTVINGGVLAVAKLANGGSNSSIGASTSAASNLVINGGVLRYNGIGDSTDRQFTLGPNGGGLDAYASGPGPINFSSTAPVTMSGTGNRTLQLAGLSTADNSLSARIDNPASGTTGLTKLGTGTWVLKNQSSTYTGVTTISGGVLAVDKLANGGQASSIGMSSNAASNIVIGTGSTLRYTGAGDTTDRLFTLSTGSSFIESSGTGAIVFSNTGSASYTGSGNRTLALGGTNTGLNTMGGAIIDGPGGVTLVAKNGSGIWALTGNNSFSGNTVVNDGNLMIGNGGTTGNAGTGNVIVNSASSTLSFNRSDSFNFAGTLSGPGSIAQIGAGTTVLTSATNAIGGVTRVDAGVLQVNGGLTTGSAVLNAGQLLVSSGGTLTTPIIAMNAGSTLTVNGTAGATAGTAATITGDAGASTIAIGAGGILRANGDLGGGSDTVNISATLDTSAGTLSLGLGNDALVLNDGAILSGGGIQGGTGGESGAGDILRVVTTAGLTLAGGSIAGFETLNKQGTGTLLLTGNHSYGVGTTITQGTLQIGNGATAGSLTTPTVTNNGQLSFNLNSNYSFGGLISGTGVVNKLGSGATTFTGNNSYTGATNVLDGTLLVNGNQSGATGTTTVAALGTLGGTGTLGGNVTVADGGTLAPGAAGSAPGALTINGALTLNNTSNVNINFGQANVAGGPLNDLISVGGSLTLDGTLSVTQTPGGTFGPGVYRIFNYGGTLTDNGLNVASPNYVVQTAVAQQVNLVNTAGVSLNFWDGDAGPKGNLAVNGGNGTWRAGGDDNWTDKDGQVNAAYSNGGYPIFAGAAGTVTVESSGVSASGMQFATSGYSIDGGTITLVADASTPSPQSIIRVGDGTAGGASYVATISSALAGTQQLVKTDLGTLVLAGSNTYSGGTAINGGTVRIASDVNLGAAAGGLSFNGGTLETTADVTTSRAVTLAGAGTFLTGALTTTTLNGSMIGAGSLTKSGDGTLVLAAAGNSAGGGTRVTAGILQVDGDLTTPGLAMAGTAALIVNGTVAAAGAAPVAVTGDAGASTLTVGSGGTLRANGDLGGGNDVVSLAGLLDTAAARLGLGDGDDRLTLTDGAAMAGAGVGGGAGIDALVGNIASTMTLDGASVTGFETLTKQGTGTLTLTGDHSYANGTAIAAGTLQIGNGGTSGALASDVGIGNGAALAFNRSDSYTFAGLITGAGAVQQIGSGTTILTANNSYSGPTSVAAGTLIVNGNQSGATGLTTVANGGTLGGIGTIGGAVTVTDGAINPGDVGAAPGTLTINGSLTLAGNSTLNYNFGQANVEGGPLNDLIKINGDLTLAGTLNVTETAGGTFGPGLYRVISYAGGLTDQGLTVTSPNYVVQTAVAQQVNLVNTAGVSLNFWDGDAGPKGNLAVNGGNGTWRAGGDDNWTDKDGQVNAAYSNGGYPIFAGAAGTVTVESSGVSASGMQFATSGYSIDGGTITLVADASTPSPQSIIRVGDGTAGGASYVATISSALAGTQQLVKTDLGTLVLAGSNTYSGGTAINGGTVRIASDVNLGAAAGGLSFNGGTLETTADVTTSRAVTLAGAGTFLTGALTTTTLNGSMIGAGSLTKSGDGTLVLAAAGNSAGGGTRVTAGILQVDGDLTTPGLAMAGTAALIVNGTVAAAGAAPVAVTGDAGASTLTVGSGGTLRANGDLGGGNDVVSLAGLLDTAAARLGLGDGDDRLTLTDGAAMAGAGVGGGAGIDALVGNIASTMTLDGASVTGFETLTKQGTGTLTLTGDHSYANGTAIAAGTLQIGNGGTSGALASDVGIGNGAALAFNRSDSYTFAGLITGAGAVQQIGSGTTILTANNSYSGPTSVAAGTLIVNGNQSGATGLTTVANGGTLGGIGTIGGAVTVTDGAINPGAVGAAPGTLTINGSLTLAGSSTLNYNFGQANVEGGPLNDLISVGGNLTLDGTLNVTETAGGNFGPGLYRVISYSGTLTDRGLALGTLPPGAQVTIQTAIANQINLLNSGGLPVSYWDGDTGPKSDGVINGGNGTWRATADDNWTDGKGTSNAPYNNGSFAIFAGKAGAVTVDTSYGEVRSSGMQFATDGYTVQNGSITLTGAQATIRVGDGTTDGAGYTATIAAELTGSAGLAKTDAGSLVLVGTNSYTGPTDIVGGTLTVDGSIANSAVTVHQGARLAGTGIVGATTVVAGGTVAPGNSIGTIHVSGSFTQATGSTYQADVDPNSTASDLIAVTGAASLQDGAVINVSKTKNAPYKLGTRYTVLSATAGLTGAFRLTGDTSLSAFTGLVDVYDANNAYLQVAQTRSLVSVAETPNQAATGVGLDSLPPTNPLLTAVVNLPNEATARQAFDQLSGEIHASTLTALIEDSHFVRDAAVDRIRQAFCAAGAKLTSYQRVGVATDIKPGDCANNRDRITGWGQAFGSWGHTQGDGNTASLTRSTAGFLLGVDAPIVDNVRLGALGGYSSSSVDIGRRRSTSESDNYHLGIYGGTEWGALGFRAGASYTWHDIKTKRQVNFQGFADNLMASYTVGTTQIFGDIGYRLEAGPGAIEPFANLAYIGVQAPGFAETGGAAALAGHSKNTSVTFATLGVRASAAFNFDGFAVTARGSLGWRHAFGDETPFAVLSFVGGTPFDVAGVPVAKDAAVLDVGLDVSVLKNVTFGLSYGGQFSGKAVDQTVRGNLNVMF